MVIVLLYHRINDSLPAGDLVVPVTCFRQQMEYLKKHCDVVGIQDLKEGSAVKGLKIILTFDDGYKDNYINAYPVLKELGLPATIFLITAMIGTDQKRPRYQHMPSPDMLGWSDVLEMAQNGISFGSHTTNHPHLRQLSSQQQQDEIEKSIAVLEKVLKERAEKIFCYPYGDYDQDTLKILRDTGIKIAFTIKPGVNDIETDPLEYRRIGVSGTDSLSDFKKKIAGN